MQPPQDPIPDPRIEAIRKALSPERFEAYRRRGESDLDALANYWWNTMLAGTLYTAVHGLEVALRNAVVDAGQACFGEVQTGEVPCWLDAKPPLLLPGETRKVQEAKGRLLAIRKPLEPGRLVAELSFGFWTALFDLRYETSKVLWPRLFKHGIFAHAPRRMRTRKALSPLLNRVRMLRNRAFHHEPIWHWRDLREQHATAMELLAWLGPELHSTAACVDVFPVVHAGGPAAVRALLEALMPRAAAEPAGAPLLVLADEGDRVVEAA